MKDQALLIRAAGSDIDAVLTHARQEGCSPVDSIKLVREIFGLSLSEAKEFVHFSRAWQDVRAANDALHDTLYKALTELPAEERDKRGKTAWSRVHDWLHGDRRRAMPINDAGLNREG